MKLQPMEPQRRESENIHFLLGTTDIKAVAEACEIVVLAVSFHTLQVRCRK